MTTYDLKLSANSPARTEYTTNLLHQLCKIKKGSSLFDFTELTQSLAYYPRTKTENKVCAHVQLNRHHKCTALKRNLL